MRWALRPLVPMRKCPTIPQGVTTVVWGGDRPFVRACQGQRPPNAGGCGSSWPRSLNPPPQSVSPSPGD